MKKSLLVISILGLTINALPALAETAVVTQDLDGLIEAQEKLIISPVTYKGKPVAFSSEETAGAFCRRFGYSTLVAAKGAFPTRDPKYALGYFDAYDIDPNTLHLSLSMKWDVKVFKSITCAKSKN